MWCIIVCSQTLISQSVVEVDGKQSVKPGLDVCQVCLWESVKTALGVSQRCFGMSVKPVLGVGQTLFKKGILVYRHPRTARPIGYIITRGLSEGDE